MDAERWRRAAEVFEAALDRPENDHRAFVQQACAGDVELLREVEALIQENGRSTPLDVPLSPETIADLSSIGKVGPYTLDSLLGVGGMGEVYRARDSRLGRDVAIKILPAGFARDRDRLARFTREAQVLASLNHPNIASIYGFETEGGVEALVLELVEGPTLADRLARGALPLSEALAIAYQIADALTAAHNAGVVHRDLKPANVKVRHDGMVKVLDFGLAKIAESNRPDGRPTTESPIITTPAVTAGAILGTAAYMSPEQAKGKPADHRSDVWGFGCLLYEMLTGRRAFDGDEVGDTFAAVLRSEPGWSDVPPGTPATVQRVMRRCLEKDPGRRYHAIADAKIDLAEAPAPMAAAVVESRGPRRERVAWALLITALLSGLVYFARQRPAPSSTQEVGFQIAPPEKAFFGAVSGIAGGLSGATISPDGARLAFVATDASGRSELWLRAIDSNVAHAIAGTDGASLPFWSPDSRSIGFFAAGTGKMKSADATTGDVRVIADAPLSRGASWGSRGVIVFSWGNPSVVAHVSADGGAVTTISDGRLGQSNWPQFLPDGRHFIYWRRGREGPRIEIASIEPGFTPRTLVRSDTAGIVMLPGILIFARGETLLQQQFDLDRLQVSGEAIPINEQVFISPAAGIADLSVSAGGALVYRPGTNTPNQFVWLDRSGRQLQTLGAPGSFRCLALSPDGKRLAYDDSRKGDIWILDLDRQTPSRFTSDPGVEACPVWFPDGSKIAYRSDAPACSKKMPAERAIRVACSTCLSTAPHR
jgi:serine/threonine protein kinase